VTCRPVAMWSLTASKDPPFSARKYCISNNQKPLSDAIINAKMNKNVFVVGALFQIPMRELTVKNLNRIVAIIEPFVKPRLTKSVSMSADVVWFGRLIC